MPAARPTIYLVDAMSNIHRAYHAIRGLSTKAGRPTNAVYGFVTMLKKMLREHPSEYLAVAFDRPEKTVRHEEYDGYKANRRRHGRGPGLADPGDPPRLRGVPDPGPRDAGLRGGRRDRHALPIRRAPAGFDVVIVTADKDMLQLVEGARVRVFHTGKEKFLDDKGVEEFFGVAPGQVVDVLALMGDSVRQHPRRARAWARSRRRSGSRSTAPSTSSSRAPTEIKGKVGESLREHTEDALLSRRLAAIKTDLPIPFDTEALKRSAPDPEKLKELFVELEFHSLAAEIQGEVAQAALSSNRLEKGKAFDVASGRLGGRRAPDARRAGPPRRGHRVERRDRRGARRRDPRALDRPRALGREARDPGRQAPRPPPRGGRPQRPLGALRRGPGAVRALAGSRQLGLRAAGVPAPRPQGDARQGGRRRQRRAARAGRDRVGRPLARRARLGRRGPGSPSRGRARRPARAREGLPRDRAAADSGPRAHGAGRNRDRRAAARTRCPARMEKDLRALEQKIWDEAGEEFNVNSPVQLGTILFEKLGLQSGRKTAKTKSFSTGVEVLNELAAQGHSLPKRVLEYREISKLKGTYVDALPALADAAGRVHSSFRQTIAATGRLSSSDPNLQNIPIRTAAGREIRRAFVAPPGRTLVVADYSQIELRILAHLSGDAALIKAFADGQDIHRITAAQGLRRRPRARLQRDALRGEADQLRPALRHGRLLARQGPRRLERGGKDLHRRLLRAVPGRARMPRRRPGRGAERTGRSRRSSAACGRSPRSPRPTARCARTPSAWP